MDGQQKDILKETHRIHRVIFSAFLLNFVLTAIKAGMAFFTNSLALTASAIDSSIDSVASLVMYGGVQLANRKTRKFPLGLYKIENVLSVMVAIFIFLSGYEIARNAFFGNMVSPHISMLVITLQGAATIAMFIFGRYATAAGRQTQSPTLVAEGRHRLVDAFSSGIVLISLVINYTGVKWTLLGFSVDQMAAVIVLGFILHAGWQLLSDGMRVLLDASIDFETLNRIRQIVKSDPMVTEVKSLVGRNAGRFRFLSIQVLLRTKNFEKAHHVSRRIEERIRHEISNVEVVNIHYEPQEERHRLFAVPLKSAKGEISDHLGDSPFFAIIDLNKSDNSIKVEQILENPYRQIEKGKGIKVAEWLVEKKIDEVRVHGDIKHKGPDYVFSNAGVDIVKTEMKELNALMYEIMEAYIAIERT